MISTSRWVRNSATAKTIPRPVVRSAGASRIAWSRASRGVYGWGARLQVMTSSSFIMSVRAGRSASSNGRSTSRSLLMEMSGKVDVMRRSVTGSIQCGGEEPSMQHRCGEMQHGVRKRKAPHPIVARMRSLACSAGRFSEWQVSERREYGSVVLVLDELLHLRRGEELGELLDPRVVLVALLHGQEVAVGAVVRGLQDQRLLGGLEVGLDGVIAVDDGGVHVVQGPRQLGRLQPLELQVLRIVGDVLGGGLGAGALLELDDAVGVQQLERPGLVHRVVGDADGGALLEVVGLLHLVRVEAERLQVHGDHGHDVGAALLVVVVEERLVLEVV